MNTYLGEYVLKEEGEGGFCLSGWAGEGGIGWVALLSVLLLEIILTRGFSNRSHKVPHDT